MRGKKEGPERLSNLLKVTQQIERESELEPTSPDPHSHKLLTLQDAS